MKKLIQMGIIAVISGILFWGCTEVKLPISVPATIPVVDSTNMEGTSLGVMTPDSGFLKRHIVMDSIVSNWQEYVGNIDSLRPDSASAILVNLGSDTASFHVYFSDDSTLTSQNVADSAVELGSIVIPPQDTVVVTGDNWASFFNMSGLMDFFVSQIIDGDGQFYIYVTAQGVNANSFNILVMNYNYFVTLFASL